MGATMLSQGGKIYISINPEESIISSKANSEELLQCIIDEIFLFEQDSIV
jgi:hypothetical protein